MVLPALVPALHVLTLGVGLGAIFVRGLRLRDLRRAPTDHRDEGSRRTAPGRDGHPEPEGRGSVKGLPSGAEVEARLGQASRLAGSLRPEDRLATKIDLTGAGVIARVKEASDLLDACRALGQAGAAAPSRKR